MPKYLKIDSATVATATLATPAETGLVDKWSAWFHTKIDERKGEAALCKSGLDHRRDLVVGRTIEVSDGDVVAFGGAAYAVRVLRKGATGRFHSLELVKLGRDTETALLEAARMFAATGRIAAGRALAEARAAHRCAMSGGASGSTAEWRVDDLARLIKAQDGALEAAAIDNATQPPMASRTVAIIPCAPDANPFDEARSESMNARAGWLRISEAQYQSARDMLPPILIEGGGWAMGEMCDLDRAWVFACVDVGANGPPEYGFFCRLMRLADAPESIIDLRLALPLLAA